MPGHFYTIERLATVAFVIGDLYLLGLWFYAIARTGLRFFWILAFAGVVFLSLAVTNVLLAYDLTRIRQLFGSQFVLLYEVFLGVQPLNLLLSIIGHTVLIRFVVRHHSSVRAPQKT